MRIRASPELNVGKWKKYHSSHTRPTLWRWHTLQGLRLAVPRRRRAQGKNEGDIFWISKSVRLWLIQVLLFVHAASMLVPALLRSARGSNLTPTSSAGGQRRLPPKDPPPLVRVRYSVTVTERERSRQTGTTAQFNKNDQGRPR